MSVSRHHRRKVSTCWSWLMQVMLCNKQPPNPSGLRKHKYLPHALYISGLTAEGWHWPCSMCLPHSNIQSEWTASVWNMFSWERENYVIAKLCNDYYLVLKGSNFASIHLAKIIPQQMSFLFSNYMATAGMCDPLIKRLRIIGNRTLKDMKC